MVSPGEALQAWTTPMPLLQCIHIDDVTNNPTVANRASTYQPQLSQNTIWGDRKLPQTEMAIVSGPGMTPLPKHLI